ncbi:MULTISPECIES: putative DNA-binding domain-containing protein [Stenotrophomonas]|uniref:DNA-binding domain-containing protein n=1 Tax=Stenotrophomonas lactitubi TaxID=2045214 RepID=A0AAW4GIB4_9GAMM|nr:MULTISPECIES: putative DNA-binding domain-containing protein [Stenotrophomonas]MBM9914542.1 putative DNA-binding domain-containing protein [Stenotrophomonas lactitubi]MBM9922837.1 putative DNA-binding domain-containing protein [Stenotrophomonas lactitubi]MBM9938671.1 putative DNA-binding domain-containing protein [Stenotrophomonas lactitubi]
MNPPVWQESLRDRFAAIRADRLHPYAWIVRDNVREAVQSCFPEFCRLRGGDELQRDVEHFIRHHAASRAPYVDLATEFMLATKDKLNEKQKVAIEYEWCLIDCDMDARHVPPPPATSTAVLQVTTNPTLRLLATPFDLLGGAWSTNSAAGPSSPYVYGVFRDHRHTVITSALTRNDVNRMLSLATSGNCTPPDDWTKTKLALGLLVPGRSNNGETS